MTERSEGMDVPLERRVGPALLPCPFCGKPPRYLAYEPGFYPESVICDSCGFALRGDHMDSPVDSWNSRAVPPNDGFSREPRSGESAGNHS